MAAPAPIRVLVVDDSAYNRQSLSQLLESDPEIRVVARAADGEQALKLVFQHEPDLVTLDLEMPKMDGFTFLRILMNRRATPVLVVSSYAGRDNVFKALELGALDFVAKPARQMPSDLGTLREELVAKVKLVRQLRPAGAAPGILPPAALPRTLPPGYARVPPASATAAPSPPSTTPTPVPPPAVPPTARPPAPASIPAAPAPAAAPAAEEALRLVVVGASTGGPPALVQLLGALDPALPVAVLIAQHMPARFTRTFAERLGRACRFEVREACDREVLQRGLVLVAPGSRSLVVERVGGRLTARAVPPDPKDRFVPSIDRMFSSAAGACQADLLAIVLTGMGDDGGRGVLAVKAAGGRVLAEAPETAVIFGMPQEAIATGAVDEVLPLGQIPGAITRFCGAKVPGRQGP